MKKGGGGGLKIVNKKKSKWKIRESKPPKIEIKNKMG